MFESLILSLIFFLHSYRDEDFYSSLAAGAGDDSDASDADPKALASSLKVSQLD
mgnify:CR=1 FL=1